MDTSDEIQELNTDSTCRMDNHTESSDIVEIPRATKRTKRNETFKNRVDTSKNDKTHRTRQTSPPKYEKNTLQTDKEGKYDSTDRVHPPGENNRRNRPIHTMETLTCPSQDTKRNNSKSIFTNRSQTIRNKPYEDVTRYMVHTRDSTRMPHSISHNSVYEQHSAVQYHKEVIKNEHPVGVSQCHGGTTKNEHPPDETLYTFKGTTKNAFVKEEKSQTMHRTGNNQCIEEDVSAPGTIHFTILHNNMTIPHSLNKSDSLRTIYQKYCNKKIKLKYKGKIVSKFSSLSVLKVENGDFIETWDTENDVSTSLRSEMVQEDKEPFQETIHCIDGCRATSDFIRVNFSSTKQLLVHFHKHEPINTFLDRIGSIFNRDAKEEEKRHKFKLIVRNGERVSELDVGDCVDTF